MPGASPSPTCVAGWRVPLPATDEYDDPLTILQAGMNVSGPWDVDEIRYFTGNEVGPGGDVVERWYVKAALGSDEGFRARWLIERRSPTTADILAVANWDTSGYESPDWTAFMGGGDPTAYLGLPGLWSGEPYDFVTGNGGSGAPGLSAEMAGCLEGT